jgi:hypothetical protein
MTYPPEPWSLRGEAVLSLWIVDGGLLCTAFVDYQPGGVMAYHELLVARPARFGVTITQIWVDSEASRDGGRELWAIPKEMASFDGAYSARGIAAAEFSWPRRGPRVPARARTRQGDVVAKLAASGRVAPVRVGWAFDSGGPLARLRGRRPVLSLAVREMTMRFGPRV